MYNYFVGDTKGWWEVSKNELKRANLLGLISTCSYEKGDYVYLDEDIDLSFFMYYLDDSIPCERIKVTDDYFSNYNRYKGGLE